MNPAGDVARVVSTLRDAIRAGDPSAQEHLAACHEIATDPERASAVIGCLAGMYGSAMEIIAEESGRNPDDLLNHMLMVMIDEVDRGPEVRW